VTDASDTLSNHTSRDLAAWLGLGTLGIGLIVVAAAAPWLIRAHGYEVFIPVLVASGLATIVATRLAASLPARAGLVVILGVGLALRLIVVAEEPLLSTDVYRYVWDGRVQGAGINPYAFVPADPQLAHLRDALIFPHINRADYAVTIYPPLAQMFFFVVSRIAETVTTMRLALMACEIATVALIIDLLRRLELPVTAVVAYAWHPLAVWEIANNGHVDALMVALMMMSLWLLVRACPIAGAVAVALAAVVKPYALVALPALWRPWDWRVPVAVIATIVVCYLPYLGAGRGVLGFLTEYVSEEGLTSGDGFWLVGLAQAIVGKLPGLTAAYLVAAAAVMGWLALRAVSRTDPTPRHAIGDVAVLLMAGLFFLSPNYAWYFLALVPFLAFGAGAPAWALTLAAFLLYRPFLLPHNDLVWKTAAFLPFVIAMAITMAMRWRASSRSSGESAWTN
jgi:alpha-1,6-mannosyltransferase